MPVWTKLQDFLSVDAYIQANSQKIILISINASACIDRTVKSCFMMTDRWSVLTKALTQQNKQNKQTEGWAGRDSYFSACASWIMWPLHSKQVTWPPVALLLLSLHVASEFLKRVKEMRVRSSTLIIIFDTLIIFHLNVCSILMKPIFPFMHRSIHPTIHPPILLQSHSFSINLIYPSNFFFISPSSLIRFIILSIHPTDPTGLIHSFIYSFIQFN